MAHFCWDCTERVLGGEPWRNDMAGLCAPDELMGVRCEGCGWIVVDYLGKRQPVPPRD